MTEEFVLKEKIIDIKDVDTWCLKWLPVDDVKEFIRHQKEIDQIYWMKILEIMKEWKEKIDKLSGFEDE